MIFLLLLFLLIITAFLGKELITKIPSQLHAPVMSALNAISGITILGAIIMCAVNTDDTLMLVISFIAIVLATINIVGGYTITGRLISMLCKKEDKK